MQTITSRLHQLIEVMHDPTALPATRLKLLLDIAEDAQKLRMGSDDKIRVACRTADEVRPCNPMTRYRPSCAHHHTQIIAHNAHNKAIVSLLTSLDSAFQPALHVRQTAFPHVAPSNLVLPTLESALYGANGRRKRVPTSNTQYGYMNGSSIGIGIGARANGIASAPMTITGSGQNTGQKKRRLDDMEADPAVRKTPQKGREKDKDVDPGRDKSKKKA